MNQVPDPYEIFPITESYQSGPMVAFCSDTIRVESFLNVYNDVYGKAYEFPPILLSASNSKASHHDTFFEIEGPLNDELKIVFAVFPDSGNKHAFIYKSTKVEKEKLIKFLQG